MKVEETLSGKQSKGRRGGWGVWVKRDRQYMQVCVEEKFKHEWRV